MKLNERLEKIGHHIELIHSALRGIAFSCDGAVEEDGVGFNKIDALIGKQLALTENLTPKQAALAKMIICKYKRQIDIELYNSIYV